jgi:secondary thiamine-phosphate synthase enzyme
MVAYKGVIEIKTREMDIVDITQKVYSIVTKSGVENGMVNIFCPGSTGAVTTIEYEPGLMKDLPAALERIAPRDAYYNHEEMWHDGNGHSHVRATIVGPGITVPVSDGRLQLGTWQQIVFVECDVRERSRTLLVNVLGE